jgi:hypothetical protein
VIAQQIEGADRHSFDEENAAVEGLAGEEQRHLIGVCGHDQADAVCLKRHTGRAGHH